MVSLDSATSWIERPVRRLSGSDRFNPLPHAGTISVFLLIIVVVSGLYITLFFQYGYEASYSSVLTMEQHPIQRTVRALHRYSSAALVLTTVVHAWRIFVAGRFGPRRRRWRWMTGVTTLLILWPAGVTGYLLVWDARAGAIADAIGRTIGFFGGGTAWWVRHLSGSGGGSGATFMVVVWVLHLGLTAVVGYFAYRHLRRSRLAWLPSRHWMVAMGGALVAVSIVLPVGMLAPVEGGRVGYTVPLDPFVLFLLPLLESSWRWVGLAVLTVLAGVVAGLAFRLRPSAVGLDPAGGGPDPVQVIESACTGCNLCVVDCPYEALSLVAVADAAQAADGGDHTADDVEVAERRDVAVVDVDACTSCGICLGSCAFDALTFGPLPDGGDGRDAAAPPHPGLVTLPADQVAGRTVIVACDRHASALHRTETGPIELVRCAGVVGPDLVKQLSEAGASAIEVVGCAVDDCRYGIGNTLAEARIGGERAPQVPRARRAMVTSRWLAPGDLRVRSEVREAGEGRDRRALVGSSVLVVASILAVAIATATPFDSESADAAIRVVLDQRPALGLEADPSFTEPVDSIELRRNGESVGRRETSRWRGDVVALEEWPLSTGESRVEVIVAGGGRELSVFTGDVEVTDNERLDIAVRSVGLAPVAEAGREVFFARKSGCQVCHSVEADEEKIGPSLHGVATRAETRVEGLDAETYLWQSILLPDQYVVDGYPAGQMLPIYRERLSQEELDALIAYLLTLTDSTLTDDAGEDGS